MSNIGINGHIVTPSKVIENGTLVIKNDRIINILTPKVLRPSFDCTYDFRGKYLYPGLIDLHLHGVLGEDTTDGNEAGLSTIRSYCASCGVTGFLATTVTEDRSRLTRALEAVMKLRNTQRPGATILGVHLEGPYLSVGRRGAHNTKFLRSPDISEMAEYISLGHGLIKRVTLAPELPGSLDLIRFLSDQSICISLGHSEADQETCFQAFQNGARLVTHLFNGMDPLHHRKPNLLSFALGCDEIAVEIIADMIHVRPEIIQIALRCKDEDHFIAVSDAVRPTGLKDGEYEFGGEQMIVQNGIARMKSTMSLAGSTSPLNKCLYNLRSHFQLSHPRLSKIGSLIPAQLIQMDDHLGSLEINKIADVAVFDDQFNCHAAFVSGVKIF